MIDRQNLEKKLEQTLRLSRLAGDYMTRQRLLGSATNCRKHSLDFLPAASTFPRMWFVTVPMPFGRSTDARGGGIKSSGYGLNENWWRL